MRRVLLVVLLSSGFVSAQNWSGILAPSRAMDWSGAGVTPPTNTTICSTITPSNSVSTVTTIDTYANAGITESGTTATVKLTTAAPYHIGDKIVVMGVLDNAGNPSTGATAVINYYGGFTVTGVSGNTFSYTVVNPNGAAVSGLVQGGSGTVALDDGPAINNAISACPANQVVFLSTGDYYVGFGIVFSEKSSVTLRGAGNLLTKVHGAAYNACGGLGAMVCFISDASHPSRYTANLQVCGPAYGTSCGTNHAAEWLGSGGGSNSGSAGNATTFVGGTYLAGATSVIINNASGLSAGMTLILDQENTKASVGITGCTESGTTVTCNTDGPPDFSNGAAIAVGGVRDGSGVAIAGYNIRPNPASVTVSGNSFSYTAAAGLTSPTGSGGNVMNDDGSFQISDQQNIFRPEAESPGESRCRLPATSDANCKTVVGTNLGAQMRNQLQVVQVGSVTGPDGSGNYTITFAAGTTLHADFDATRKPGAWWIKQLKNSGVESMTLDATLSSAGSVVVMQGCYGCWEQYTSSIASNNYAGFRNHVWVYFTAHSQVINNYFYGYGHLGNKGYGIEPGIGSDDLVQNNIFDTLTAAVLDKSGMGDVFSYNYFINCIATSGATGTGWSVNTGHDAGAMLALIEGNTGCQWNGDMFHGVGGLNTGYRNYFNGRNGTSTNFTVPVDFYAGIRANNVIANVLGTPAYHTQYQDVVTSTTNGTNAYTSIYVFGAAGNGDFPCGSGGGGNVASNDSGLPCDTNVHDSTMRWGNYDVVTAAVRECTANATPIVSCTENERANGISKFAGLASPSTTFPNSFYLNAQPVWWATTWGTPPWPAIGPDVAGGTGPGGFAYKIPAQLCFENLTSTNGILNFDPVACYGVASISAMAASPAATCPSGNQTTLTCTGAGDLIINQGVGIVQSGVGVNVSPKVNTTYTCSSGANQKSATVYVNCPIYQSGSVAIGGSSSH